MNSRKNFEFVKRDGSIFYYSHNNIKNLIRRSANRVLVEISEEEIDAIDAEFLGFLNSEGLKRFTYKKWRGHMAKALEKYPAVLNSFMSAHKNENAAYFDEVCEEMNKIVKSGDKSTGSVDSSLTSSKRALIVDALEKITYREYHLEEEQKSAFKDGYIYIHDMGHRRDSINCCLFDLGTVLSGGFEMGDMWYDEPDDLREFFDVTGSVSLNAAAQIYGGFTIAQIDELIVKYAEKSFIKYRNKYLSRGMSEQNADDMADADINEDLYAGFFSLEEKFNSVISPRGDYPFITITFGLVKNKYAQAASKAALEVRKKGHGKEGFKRPVLFPKLVFLYDKDLHGKGCELYELFRTAVFCSSKVMYPEYLSLTGEKGIVADVYRKYGKVISPMCCRAFLTKWFERGGEEPADENDVPVFIGRFNIGVVSLNLPMIFEKSRREEKDFYSELDYYLELCRQIHIRTYESLAKKKAHTNPLAFMQGGLYGGTLGRDDCIEPLLKSATASFGFTALNELQRLYNGKSIAEDGDFALEVLKYINKKTEEFQKQDHIQYSVYGTPAESLCGRQVKSFRKKFGENIKNVSDRDYFSNSFHCHVSEDIDPVMKQDLEARFWDYSDGGKIQYIRFTVPHNTEALEAIIEHAMELGLYEGINLSLAYCNNCGYEWCNDAERPEICPECGSPEMTMIERMCGYIAYTKMHGTTRLNDAKMAEINDRVCM